MRLVDAASPLHATVSRPPSAFNDGARPTTFAERRMHQSAAGQAPRAAASVSSTWPSESRQSTPGRSKSHCRRVLRSEEHTSELQSLMRISYAVFCLKKKTNTHL